MKHQCTLWFFDFTSHSRWRPEVETHSMLSKIQPAVFVLKMASTRYVETTFDLIDQK